VLWLVPALGVVVNLYALATMDDSPQAVGRKPATIGLVLSLLLGAAAPARIYSYEYFQKREARDFAQQWFDALRQDKPHRAYQLTLAPNDRLDDEHYWVLYRKSTAQQTNLRSYVDTPLVRTLLALGDKADIRLYQNETAQTDGRIDVVRDVYAVSYPDEGRTKTFFIKAELSRSLKTESGPIDWKIYTEGGYRPQGWTDAG
jgi:hypothetical protein